MPSPENVHVDTLLTAWGVGFDQEEAGFVADRIMPIVPVEQQSDKYVVWGKESWRTVDDLATPRSVIREIDYEVSSTTYTCDGHALEVFIENARNEDPPHNKLRDAVYLLSKQLHLNREKAVIDAAVATGASATASATVAWGSTGTTTIVQDVDTWKQTVRNTIGSYPNVAVMGPDVLRVLKTCAEIRNYLQYSVGGVVTEQLLASLFGLDEVLVSTAAYDSARKGQTFSATGVFPASTFLLFRRPGSSRDRNGRTMTRLRDPGWARMLYWVGPESGKTGVQFTRFPDPRQGTHGGVVVKGRHYYAPVITSDVAAIKATVL